MADDVKPDEIEPDETKPVVDPAPDDSVNERMSRVEETLSKVVETLAALVPVKPDVSPERRPWTKIGERRS